MSTTNPIAVPSLSLSGWVTSGQKKADFLFSHFFLANYSQTYLYRGNVISLQWLLQRYMKDIPGLAEAMQSALLGYLGRYYSEGVSVSVESETATDTNISTIKIFITVSEGGVLKNFGKLLNVEGAKIIDILDYINNGTTAS